MHHSTSRGRGGRERDRKSKWWLWTRVSVSCLTRRTIPTEQRGYKNTFGHLTNFHCVELLQICSLSFVRLRLRDQFRPADMEKSLAYTSISLTPIAHYSIDTHRGAHVHSSPIHTHITHNHNQDFSSSCEIKGRTSVWLYHLYYIYIYLERLLSYKIFLSYKICAILELVWKRQLPLFMKSCWIILPQESNHLCIPMSHHTCFVSVFANI